MGGKRLEKRKTEKRMTEAKLKSVTRFLFVTTQVCAIIWVFISYGIALYSTIRLGQVYTMSELSEPAITAILGVTVMKVIGNIFEHNDSVVFGHSKEEINSTDGGEY